MIATKAAAFISISAMMILLTLFHSIVYYSRNQRCLQYRFRKNTPRQPGGAHISFIHIPKVPAATWTRREYRIPASAQ